MADVALWSGSAYIFVVKKTDGEPCTLGSECLSAECIDGLCCDTACGGTCEACNLSGLEGTCSLVPFGQDPNGDCSASESCDGNGICLTDDGQGCSIPAACLSGFCADDRCCDSACTGVCEACTAAKNGATDGLCAPT